MDLSGAAEVSFDCQVIGRWRFDSSPHLVTRCAAADCATRLVGDRYGEEELEIAEGAARVTRFQYPAHGLHPAEDFFNPFAQLTDFLARMPGGAPINRARLLLCHVWRYAKVPQHVDELRRVAMLVGPTVASPSGAPRVDWWLHPVSRCTAAGTMQASTMNHARLQQRAIDRERHQRRRPA
jgi:hypothetical protein